MMTYLIIELSVMVRGRKPFIGLPTYEENEQVQSVVTLETVEEVNELDEIQSIDEVKSRLRGSL